jgi:phage terminase small subunit
MSRQPITEQQRTFVKHRVLGMSIVASARLAGYADPETNGYRLEKTPKLVKLMASERVKYEAAADITRREVIEGIKEGIEIGKAMQEGAVVINGWEKVAKICGLNAPERKEINVNLSGKAQIEHLRTLTDEQLLELANAEVLEGEFEEVEDDDETMLLASPEAPGDDGEDPDGPGHQEDAPEAPEAV